MFPTDPLFIQSDRILPSSSIEMFKQQAVWEVGCSDSTHRQTDLSSDMALPLQQFTLHL